MEFYRPTIERIDELNYYLQHNRFYGCHLALANVILWSEHYNTCYTTVADMLVFCQMKDGRPCAFTFPVGNGDAKAAFDAIVCYFKKEGLPICFYLVEEAMFEQIEAWYPGVYVLQLERDDADYLYESEALATLKGKKLHAKRNHRNRFLENYPDYQYEEITDDNMLECLELAKNWKQEKEIITPKAAWSKAEYEYEYKAIERALHNRERLMTKGAILRVNGKVIAFTIGSPINDNVFDIHFEKAYADIQGAYTMINCEFARRSLLDYPYINREEDIGIEGLRKSKLSYHPVKLVQKGTVFAYNDKKK